MVQKKEPLDRPNITSLEEQRCQEDYQTTMLEQINKYRSLYGMDPLQVSKKLQFVALLAAQRCRFVLNVTEEGTDNLIKGNLYKFFNIVDNLQIFSTIGYCYNTSSIGYNRSSIECKKNAVNEASDGHELENIWIPLLKEENITYMGCAFSIVNNTGFHSCYFQIDEGADKLELNIVPPDFNIDLESYNDSFWTQFQGKSNLKLIIIERMFLFSLLLNLRSNGKHDKFDRPKTRTP